MLSRLDRTLGSLVEWTDDTSMAPRSDDVADDRSEHGADEDSRNAVIDCSTFAVQEL